MLLIALGAAVGAPARYLTDRAIQSRRETVFPWGTLTVNLVASFLLGALAGAVVNPNVMTLVGTGFCGALSTYSTFSYETLRLAQGPTRAARFYAVTNVAVSLVGGIGAAAFGWALGAALT